MLIAFTAGKGAPGVTTSALALSLSWPSFLPPEAVLVECDPAGADLPWRVTTTSGRPLDQDRGITSWVAASRTTTNSPALLREHSQEVDGGLRVVIGPAGPAQADALGASGWSRIPDLLTTSGFEGDVLVDCGRLLAPQAVQTPILAKADAIVVVARPSLSGVAHLQKAITTAAQSRNQGTGSGLAHIGVLVVDKAARPGSRRASARDVKSVLDATPGLTDLPVLGVLAWDPRTAAAWAGDGQIRRRARLTTTATRCAMDIRAWAAQLRTREEVSR